ncbi:hypothetical protein [Silvibacterium dinghuense]|uniref:Uncharacterized protein n=1 Tax=Silvibacterium dinghuense TaxID=1560006 RepID=A0A4Q1SGL1_9BACT|nr:hypothetical protein [Silvibacterium dinghuense]RXS96644.1 hypothetical protein ESZ00_01465 [Silvibacterium dinghuense]GGG92486.1 hypothetical protein GCM10011586_03990 [Silvibacterium dinghuense]
MPALELRIAETMTPVPATRLRTLLEKPNAVVLRRNHVVEPEVLVEGMLREKLRVTCILAVDITHPPEPNAPKTTGPASLDEEDPDLIEQVQEDKDEFADRFAKGVEFFIATEKGPMLLYADFDELTSALTLFDAYERIARYQPAYLRLDQRSIGIGYGFREGLVVGIAGELPELRDEKAFASLSSLQDLDDVRAGRRMVRLPHAGIRYLQELLEGAGEWLDRNSYKSILGA